MKLATLALAIMLSTLAFGEDTPDSPGDDASDPSAVSLPGYVNRYRTPRTRHIRSRTPLATPVPAAHTAAPAAAASGGPVANAAPTGDADPNYEKRLEERQRTLAQQRRADEARRESAVVERAKYDNTADDELSRRRYDLLDALGNK